MLVDAFRSEAFRLLRNRMVLFWSVLFVPLIFSIGGCIYHLMAKSRAPDLAEAGIPPSMGSAPVNLGDALTLGADAGSNGVILVMMLIAAATLYAGDYRWESWRLISARNTRPNMILGKVGVLKAVGVAAMLVFLAACFVFTVAQAIVFDRPLTFSYAAADWGRFALVWLLGLVRIVQYAMIALLAAVLTRSLLAALFVPFALGFVQSIFGQAGLPLLGWEPGAWSSQLVLPGLAYDTLKAAIGSGEGDVVRPLVSLALWTLAPLIAAAAWFQRQDLSKE
ncbi:MAG: ABC transporter permease [Alphaproteobacteria bacterium]|nr:ABC transporter permease [Alphaproteobacteria bacterium]MBU1524746.1 ABC transporter permease [Alphaproteobacteria bacterium]MBU2118592.1 ABC transporter permease [Alphaproteobacteria bacterium]MBU2351742.1 ABC transporter permease [Alphaproteobacteria bacterium]MBU2383428.1 ABC transporter permease [Alphaproteobacteria bacterium]